MSRLEIWGVEGLPEIRAGDDLAALLATAEPGLRDGDVVVVTSKVVSKAEGRVRTGDREAAITAETARMVARRGNTRIARTHHGFVLAAAGVDGSNTEPGTVILLPEDPDASARHVRAGLRARLGVTVAVVVSDTFGRPWRNGVTDVAVGLAGIRALDDLRGWPDSHGNVLDVTVTAAADEISGAADLVKGKLTRVPAAVVRGLGDRVHSEDGQGVAPMLRPDDEDMFRYGSRDVVTARRTIREFRQDPVDRAALWRAVGAAVTAPAPPHTTPWRFVLVESADARKRLLEAMVDAWTGSPYAWTGGLYAGLGEDPADERTHAGDVLGSAPCLVVPCLVVPCLVVPCLVARSTPPDPDTRRSGAEREMFTVALGAAVENLLVTLAAEGLGSCWAPSTTFRSGAVARELELPPGWEPMGAIGVGYPATPPAEREPADPDDVLILR